MKCIKFNKQENYIKDFIKLPKKLYDKKTNTEDKKTMKSILLGKHPLNKYFKLNKFLVYDNKEVVGRFIITEYPHETKTCYIGFFECINNREVAKFIFDEVYKFAKQKKYKKIVGPVDASFWIKYRLKINKFNTPYTGEPYNKDYYFDMFKDNKYEVVDHYITHIFQSIDESFQSTRYKEHYQEFIDKGYKIIKPDIKDFEKCIGETYDLIMDLYKDFPIFKSLTKKDFIKVFSSYKSIINMNMVRMAYYEDKAVGFYISIPDYNNIVYNLNIFKIPKILKLRKKPNRYVMLYMGVDQKHIGLGKALIEPIIEELRNSHLPSIGALQHDGKITQKYGEDAVDDTYEYVLLERKI